MEKWFIKNKKADFKLIAKQFGISEILARLSVNREVTSMKEMKEYLYPSLEQMHDPMKLKDMERACNIIIKKIQEGKKIRIVGDYDVDGVMATYILNRGLTTCGAVVDYEIPERIKDGYGINVAIIDAAFSDGIDTIITCDNGIAALSQIEHAKELGMTVIVTDHHDIAFTEEENGQRTYKLPVADAVINPKQKDCNYPFEGICGGVVAYKFIQALYDKMGIDPLKLEELLEFATIATVCDVMDLVNENRALVKVGLERITRTSNMGLQALIQATGIQDRKITVYHLGFVIGPCINASGRLESAKMSLKLLLEDNWERAKKQAKALKELNDERKDMTSKGVIEAVEYIEQNGYETDKVLIVYLPNCHESLAGIIAGRMKERYHKPTIVLCDAHEGVKGSARSIEEYNMFEELIKCKNLLTKFGGHPMAAGLSLAKENIEPLRKALNEKTTLTEDDLAVKVCFDMVLPLEQINFNLLHELSLLEPYGKGNAKPSFALKNVHVIKGTILGKNRNVMKLMVEHEQAGQVKFPAMLFHDIESLEQFIVTKYGEEQLQALYAGYGCEVKLDLVFYPDINEYNGTQTIQIMIQNYR